MCLADRLEIQQILRERCTSIFDILYRAFEDSQPGLQTELEVHNKLVNLAERLIECLLVEPFDPQQAEDLGVSLAYVCNERLWRENAELRQPQAKLITSEIRLNSILSSIADFVFVFDSEERFIFHHSPRMDGLYMPPEAFLGKTHLEVMPSRMQASFAEAMDKNRRGGVAQYEYWLEIGGKVRWFSVIMSPVFLDGDFTGSVAVAREVTKIKEMQRELQQTHEALEWQAERCTTRLKILHEMDRAILSVQSPKTIAEVALRHIRQLVPCLGGIVSLFESESDVIILAAEINDECVIQKETRFPIAAFNGTSELIEFLQQGRVHTLEDTFVPQSSPAIQVLREWRIRSLLSVPLVVENKSIGALSLGMENPGSFASEYVEIAEEIAESLAIAIQQSRLMERMSASRSRLRRLTQQMISTQEEERRRLARTLHDEVGQALIALKISLGLLREDLPTGLETLHQRLSNALSLTTHTMEHLRSLAHDLRPPTLDAAGLRPALQSFCDEFSRYTQLSITYTDPEVLPKLSDEANICLYRFLQEALTNVAKHAVANQVEVALCYDNDMVSLVVADDGHGFDEQARLSAQGWPMGIGLLGMQERLESLGGWLKIKSQSGQGTCLTACLPVNGKSLEGNS